MASNATLDFVISEADMKSLQQMDRITNYGEFDIFPVFSGKPLAKCKNGMAPATPFPFIPSR